VAARQTEIKSHHNRDPLIRIRMLSAPGMWFAIAKWAAGESSHGREYSLKDMWCPEGDLSPHGLAARGF